VDVEHGERSLGEVLLPIRAQRRTAAVLVYTRTRRRARVKVGELMRETLHESLVGLAAFEQIWKHSGLRKAPHVGGRFDDRAGSAHVHMAVVALDDVY